MNDQEHPSANPAQVATAHQLEQTETRIEERMSSFERSMIRLTWAAVIISILSIIVFAGQLYEMIAGGTATDKLVEYTRAQANAGNDQADAAQQFSDTTEEINAGINSAVDQLESAANNAKASIQATQNAMRLEQR